MQIKSASALAAAAMLGVFVFGPSSGCSSSSNGGTSPGDDDAGGSSSGSMGFGQTDSSVPSVTCPAGSGYQCQSVTCTGNTTTTITGVVYDPAGTLPLYNVAVYIPNGDPVDLPEGVSCADCASWYTPAAFNAVTDAGGNFTINNAPVGTNIPLIVQVGKWRMQYTLSSVKGCVDNDAATLAGSTIRMPRNHTEGHIPNIAISTGKLDSLECLIRRMGIDAAEYTGNPTTSPDGPRIHIFTGGYSGQQGAVTQNPQSDQSYQYLWGNDTQMQAYDVVLLACEGQETYGVVNNGSGATAQNVLLDYVNNGGRVFASHYHYVWFNTGPFAAFPIPLAKWTPEGQKAETVGPDGDEVSYPGDVVQTLPNGKPFPEGVALHTWLGNVKALTNNQLPIWYARHNADLSSANSTSQAWITLDPSVTAAPNGAEYFSFDTPVGGGEQCGRVVYSDLHVSGGIGANEPGVPADYTGLPITPDGCAVHPLTPQEKALEFMIFDLSSCLTPIGQMPMGNPPPK